MNMNLKIFGVILALSMLVFGVLFFKSGSSIGNDSAVIKPEFLGELFYKDDLFPNTEIGQITTFQTCGDFFLLCEDMEKSLKNSEIKINKNTFEVLYQKMNIWFARDKNNVYVNLVEYNNVLNADSSRIVVLPDADPATFRPYTSGAAYSHTGFGRDKNNVYYLDKKLDTDAGSFKVVSYDLAYDDVSVFMKDKKLVFEKPIFDLFKKDISNPNWFSSYDNYFVFSDIAPYKKKTEFLRLKEVATVPFAYNMSKKAFEILVDNGDFLGYLSFGRDIDIAKRIGDSSLFLLMPYNGASYYYILDVENGRVAENKLNNYSEFAFEDPRSSENIILIKRSEENEKNSDIIIKNELKNVVLASYSVNGQFFKNVSFNKKRNSMVFSTIKYDTDFEDVKIRELFLDDEKIRVIAENKNADIGWMSILFPDVFINDYSKLFIRSTAYEGPYPEESYLMNFNNWDGNTLTLEDFRDASAYDPKENKVLGKLPFYPTKESISPDEAYIIYAKNDEKISSFVRCDAGYATTEHNTLNVFDMKTGGKKELLSVKNDEVVKFEKWIDSNFILASIAKVKISDNPSYKCWSEVLSKTEKKISVK